MSVTIGGRPARRREVPDRRQGRAWCTSFRIDGGRARDPRVASGSSPCALSRHVGSRSAVPRSPPGNFRLPRSDRSARSCKDDTLTRSELANGMQVLVLEDHAPAACCAEPHGSPRRGNGRSEARRARIVHRRSHEARCGRSRRARTREGGRRDRRGALGELRVGIRCRSTVSGLSRDLPMPSIEILTDVALHPRFERKRSRARARPRRWPRSRRPRTTPATLARWYTAIRPCSKGTVTAFRFRGQYAHRRGPRRRRGASLPRPRSSSPTMRSSRPRATSGPKRCSRSRTACSARCRAPTLPDAGPPPSLPAPAATKILIVDRPGSRTGADQRSRTRASSAPTPTGSR